MEREIAAIALTLTAAASAAAAPAASPAAREANWARDLEPIPAAVAEHAPKKSPVEMTILRAQSVAAVVSEPTRGIDVDVRRDGKDFLFAGYIKAHGVVLGETSMSGVAVKGGGVAVEAKPEGDASFRLAGAYKKEDGSEGALSLRLDSDGKRDFSIRSKGVELEAKWTARGYILSGYVDPAAYGRRELAILGGALAALTDDSFR
jgi:hypothetical protein